MTVTELRSQLKSLGVSPPNALRASLYLGELQATSVYLKNGLATILGSDYARVKTAVQDPELLNTLCKVLDGFVAQAVQADVKSQRVIAAQPQGFDGYYNQFIFTGDYATNLNTFYGLFPVTAHVVQQAATNFRNNIRQACTRIIHDWANIQKTFLPQTQELAVLTRIKSSGSDFHKGGQQVLLLTFEKRVYVMDSDDGHLQSLNFNLVYKPSDLELDCLLAGNTAAVNAVHSNFQAQSLFELLNGLIAAKKKTSSKVELELLPTYKILPIVYGSGLTAGINGKLPIRNSYGYLEFLQHDHYDGLLSSLGLYWGGSSDYKIFNAKDKDSICTTFYRIIGQVTAIACTFSIVDLHIENIIVNSYLPYPIDMEISLIEEITDVDNTSLFTSTGKGGVNGLRGGNKVTWNEVVAANGRLAIQDSTSNDVEQNRLYMVNPPALIDPRDYGAEICRSMRDMLRLLQEGNAAGRFTAWLNRLTNVVVRYLPMGTGDFASILSSTVNSANCGNANKLQQVIAFWRGTLYTTWNSNTSLGRLPNFAALQDAFVLSDYQNGDIPIFYHRINTTPPAGLDIMDSDGNRVTMPAQITYLDSSDNLQTVNVAVGRNTFFSQSPLTSPVTTQIAYLGTNFNRRVSALVRNILAVLGLDSSLRNIKSVLK